MERNSQSGNEYVRLVPDGWRHSNGGEGLAWVIASHRARLSSSHLVDLRVRGPLPSNDLFAASSSPPLPPFTARHRLSHFLGKLIDYCYYKKILSWTPSGALSYGCVNGEGTWRGWWSFLANEPSYAYYFFQTTEHGKGNRVRFLKEDIATLF